MLITMNKLVACTPFEAMSAEVKKTRGLSMIDTKLKLVELDVVMFCGHDPGLAPGTKVSVRADSVAQPWAKEIYVQGDVEFILVPIEAIKIANTPGGTAPWQSGC